MKTALRLISGEGDFENGWNRLFGIRSGLGFAFVLAVGSWRLGEFVFAVATADCPKEVEDCLLPNSLTETWDLEGFG